MSDGNRLERPTDDQARGGDETVNDGDRAARQEIGAEAGEGTGVIPLLRGPLIILVDDAVRVDPSRDHAGAAAQCDRIAIARDGHPAGGNDQPDEQRQSQ